MAADAPALSARIAERAARVSATVASAAMRCDGALAAGIGMRPAGRGGGPLGEDWGA